MNKQELIQEVATATETTKACAEKAVNAVLSSIEKGLKKDKSVQLVGFGTFGVRTRKARTGRNPRTGEPIKIKASRTVGFKAGKGLKEAV